MGTHDTPPDELPLSTLGGTAAGTGNGSMNASASAAHSNFKSASPKDPLLPEECARLKPANGDHTAYGAAPNAHPPPPLDHSSPLIETPSNGSGPTSGAGGPTSRSTTTTAKRHSLLLSRGDTELSIDHSGLQRFLPKCMHSTFVDRDAEKLYQEYYSNEKRSDFRALLLIVTVVNLLLLLLQVLATVTSGAPPQLTDSHGMRHLVGMGVCLLVCCLLFGLAFRRSTAETDEAFESKLWTVLPYGLWAVMTVQIVGDLWTFTGGHGPAEAGSSSLIWLLLYTYSIYVIFPLRFRLVCTLSLGMAGIQLITVLAVAETRYKFARQILANLLLIGSVNLLSVMSFYFYERQQRRAFLETRQSLEAKILLEEESEEQERLLLSVLPKHVAAEIRQDLGAVVEGQFHKIYMSRHENVSILFADIVGFTAFSSTVTAPELVKTLNELFARFDKLSEKYHQLRIKILGDCYYCISGAPQERPDHAVLCVHMGLSMVEAIKSVREQTKSGVDMRVGVHTGGILAGVLGQRQWQFDVYSRDVEFANKMESGGLPGRVHISERTLSFLNGEFEVIDGEGATREEAIRLAGVKTYFIVKVLKPYPEGTLDANLIDAANGANGTGQSGQEDNETTKLNAPRDSSPLVHLSTEDRDTTLYSSRLHGELIHRDSHQMFGSSIHPLRLTFKDATLEADYRDCRDTTSVVSLLALPLTLTVVLLVYFLVAPIRLHTALTLLVCALILLFIAFICTVPMVVSSIPKPFALLCNSVQAKSWLRLTIVIIMLAFWVAALVVLNIFYAQPLGPTPLNNPPPHPPSAQPPLPIDPGTRLSTSYRPPAHPETPALALPQYLLFFSLLCLLAITALTRISYLAKIALISSLVIGQAVLLYTHLSRPFALYVDLLGLVSNLDIRHYYLLILATLLLALVIINRQFELMTRRLFLWQRDVDQQKSKVSDMRRKNEKLVYNILPPNVAIHFLGKRKSDEELYSKSYECVGVLFASMPNFSDFYTEESVNNQGLECIRFLNEVISDYDQLLSQPRFKDISKIKTISSTYMAATGLTEEVATVAEAATEITTRWAHLAQLTEFALTLKETLNFINKESFNNFVLRMGINQGPITAGVIGARKPHYDIWGNTVNVASRMESTGKAGCIQVVEETSKILEHFGYIFEQRGLVSVKGKGKLMTYYLVGKKPSSPK